MTDVDSELLLPVVLATFRLTTVMLSAQIRAGTLSPQQCEAAAEALRDLEAEILPHARSADMVTEVLGGIQRLIERLSAQSS